MREKHITKGLSNNEEAGGTMLSWLLTGWELRQQQEKGRARGTGLNFLRSWLQLPLAALSWPTTTRKVRDNPRNTSKSCWGQGKRDVPASSSVLRPKVRQTLPVPAELGHQYECTAVCNRELARLRQHELQTETTLV